MILGSVSRWATARSKIRVQLALAVAALVAATVTATVLAAGHTDPIAAHPAPALFSQQQVQPWVGELAQVRARADQAFARWALTHPDRDDAAFTAFALGQIPPVPASAEQRGELVELRSLASQRTPAGLAAADWLEVHGKGDIWKRYLDEASVAGVGERQRAVSALDDDLALAGRLSTTAQRRFARPSPSAVEPGLRTHPRLSKLSYPSSHSIAAVSALVVLSAADPGRAQDFQQMAAQVLFSRLYAAGHYRSDLLAGAYVGALLGDYEARQVAGGRVLGLAAPLSATWWQRRDGAVRTGVQPGRPQRRVLIKQLQHDPQSLSELRVLAGHPRLRWVEHLDIRVDAVVLHAPASLGEPERVARLRHRRAVHPAPAVDADHAAPGARADDRSDGHLLERLVDDVAVATGVLVGD